MCADNVCAMCVLCTLIAASYDGRLVSPRCTFALLLSTFLFPINTALRDKGVWLPFGSTRIALRPGLLSNPCSHCHFQYLGCTHKCCSIVAFVSGVVSFGQTAIVLQPHFEWFMPLFRSRRQRYVQAIYAFYTLAEPHDTECRQTSFAPLSCA